jgi:hypothetical protein
MTTGPDATFDDEERRYFETLKDWISRQQADGIPLGRIGRARATRTGSPGR